ncbi:hypothetical protein [Hydrogenophaga sp.]|uniref:hypothetical protein n=1 Tax=Hydrogenophaga sp. TaxID=1904254 RepID=UPI00286E79DC|nr:hypothetical protein [Hydrogenophaga sp.]
MLTTEHPGNNEPVDEAEERAFLEQRDQVSDEELTARMLAAPDCGGELLIELSEFVARRIPGAGDSQEAPL